MIRVIACVMVALLVNGFFDCINRNEVVVYDDPDLFYWEQDEDGSYHYMTPEQWEYWMEQYELDEELTE